MQDIEFERGLPAALDAERTLIGAVLLDNEVFFDDFADLAAEDFFIQAHRHVFQCINEILFGLVEGVTKVDIVTLSETLSKRKQLESVGGVAWLASLTEGLPRKLSCTEYARIVKDKAKLRSLISICSTTITRCADMSEDAAKIREDIQEQLIEEDAEGDGKAVKVGEVIPKIREQIEKDRKIVSERTALELTWGLSGLDEATKGAFGGEFTVVAGDAGSGKTPFGVQMTLANAREGIPCAWFSIEMPKERLARRFYPAMGDTITANHMRDPRLINEHTHIPEIERLSAELRGLPIWIDDTSPLTINKLVARIRMMRRKMGIRLFVVDYLQLIESRKARSETEEAKANIFAIRDLVKAEPSIHLLAISQYSHSEGFAKKGKRYKKHLYGGSALEHAAQNIFRISIEDPAEKTPLDLLEVDINIDKLREGKRQKVTCMFDQDHLVYTYPQRRM